MKIGKAIFICVLLYMLAASGCAQQKYSIHWGVEDGLASSTVYCSFQDRKGFMWFGTDLGLCRFDGTNFKTYTVADGLSDNDVLWISEDNNGRLWIVCFNSIPCYMENGVIHKYTGISPNPPEKNDYPVNICVGSGGNVLVALHSGIYEIDSSLNLVKNYLFSDPLYNMIYYNHHIIVGFSDSIIAIDPDRQRRLYTSLKNETITKSFYEIRKGNLYFTITHNFADAKILFVNTDGGDIKTFCSVKYWPNSFKLISDSVARVTGDGINGIMLLNKNHPDKMTSYFSQKPASGVFFDRDSNAWINTVGGGIYMVPAQGVRIYNKESGLRETIVNAICGDSNGKIVVGYRVPGMDILFNNKITPAMCNACYNFSSLSIKQHNGDFYVGTSSAIFRLDGAFNLSKIYPRKGTFLSSVKKLDVTSSGDILYVNPGAAHLYPFQSGSPDLCLLHQRSTAIAVIDDSRYAIGTLNGLFVYENGRPHKYNGDTLLSKSHIFDICVDSKKRIWASTYQNGVFRIDGNKVKIFNVQNGLLSNICKSIFIDEADNVWVSNNKGLNKIEQICDTGYKIRKFDVSDGLPVSEINGLYVNHGNIWLATAIGVVTFNEGQIMELPTVQPPPVYILSFYVQDSVYTTNRPIELSYRQNNIRIDYAGVTFNSGHNIQYKYLLQSSNITDTVYTSAASIRFGALAADHYTLYIWAANKRGVWSTCPARVSFSIRPPFWQKAWFYVLITFVLLAGAWLYFRFRIASFKKKEDEKALLNKRMSELELQALRAQMNPHFIFNALNAIQSFYAENDELSANRYMTIFSTLIRQILHSSTQNVISLEDELTLLRNYTELEKMRFKDKFECEIKTSENINPQEVFLPVMLIQPFVENAINHGLRFIENYHGLLSISFVRNENLLICIIDDNGIGVKASQQRKAAQNSKHVSEGMKITHHRVDALNAIYHNAIEISFTDKAGKGTGATGVTVIIRIPVINQNKYPL